MAAKKPPFTIDELLVDTFGENWREETKYGIRNYANFDKDEQHHIMALNRRKNELANIKTARAGWDHQKSEEFAALKWIFTVLEEIYEDDEE